MEQGKWPSNCGQRRSLFVADCEVYFVKVCRPDGVIGRRIGSDEGLELLKFPFNVAVDNKQQLLFSPTQRGAGVLSNNGRQLCSFLDNVEVATKMASLTCLVQSQ